MINYEKKKQLRKQPCNMIDDCNKSRVKLQIKL